MAKSPENSPTPPAQAAIDHAREWQLTLASFLLLSASIWLVYGRAVNDPFIFDDQVTVLDNPSIRQLWPLIGDEDAPGPLNPTKDFPTAGRPLVNLSFALNYWFDAADPRHIHPAGYRLINILLHALSAALLAAIVRRTLQLPYFGGRFDRAAWPLSVAAAMMWALHPMQTEAVVYVTQRTELLVGFFYLATMYCSIRYWSSTTSGARSSWLALATVSCLAGMASKEVMVSVPLAVLLFERTFVAGSFWQALRRSWPLYAGLSLGLILLFALNITGPRSTTAGFHLEVPVGVWWLTQCKMLVMYLRLAVWPWPLSIHYADNYLASLSEAWPWVAAAAVLALGTLLLVSKNRPAGFVTAFVWMILAPTLVVPIITEVAAERRMYLPLAALVSGAAVGGYSLARWLGQTSMDNARDNRSTPVVIAGCLWVALIVAAGCASAQRLAVYVDLLSLWQDAELHQPEDSLVHNNLANLLSKEGKTDEAIAHLRRSLELKPNNAPAHYNWGVAVLPLGRLDEAVEHLQRAVQIKPNASEAQTSLAAALLKAGRPQEALEHAERAIKLKLKTADAYYNLGNALVQNGRPQDAVVAFEMALRVDPDDAPAHMNLGSVLLNLGQLSDAQQQFEAALRIKPDFAECHNNLAAVLAKQGHTQEAIEHGQRALELARAQGQTALAQTIEGWLTPFRAAHPSP